MENSTSISPFFTLIDAGLLCTVISSRTIVFYFPPPGLFPTPLLESARIQRVVPQTSWCSILSVPAPTACFLRSFSAAEAGLSDALGRSDAINSESIPEGRSVTRRSSGFSLRFFSSFRSTHFPFSFFSTSLCPSRHVFELFPCSS